MPSIIEYIKTHPNPYELADWWANETETNPTGWSTPLETDEIAYFKIFSFPEFEPEEQIRPMLDPNQLTDEEKTEASEQFGDNATAVYLYANRKNRLRIIQHYVWHSPAVTNYAMALYRLTRDTNPISFAVERGWQIGSGKEMFTNQTVSRARATAELVVPMLISAGLRGILKGVAPVSPNLINRRSLDDPIWDLPAEGGGLRINGRWYTEHALERMAPDTIPIRVQLRNRVMARLEKLGLRKGSTAYNRAMDRALEKGAPKGMTQQGISNAYQNMLDRKMNKIDPRGVPPAVVEAEIAHPGSTNVRVVTAKRGSIVVTVIHRR